MKRFQIAVLTVLISSISISIAQAQHNGVNGIIIGAGSGALIGQAIGRDTESTLVGSAVGGLVGYVIGNEKDHNGRIVHYDNRYHRPINNHYQSPPVYRGKPFSSHQQYRERNKVCRETVKIKEHYGRSKRVVSKTCWYEKPHDRHDRYDRYDRRDYRDRYNRR